MSLFKNKTLLITGGTGSFGNAVLNRFLQTDIGEIRIFSRDEKKQDDMRHEFQVKMQKLQTKLSSISAMCAICSLSAVQCTVSTTYSMQRH